MSDVEIQYASSENSLPLADELRSWAHAALAVSEKDYELVIRLVDQDESADLNQRYRNRSHATNVLSFPFEAPPAVALNLLGDIVICAPVVHREAREQGKTLQAHWAHMVIHGVLHLLGYDHSEEDQAVAMEALEIQLLDSLGYPNPYITI